MEGEKSIPVYNCARKVLCPMSRADPTNALW